MEYERNLCSETAPWGGLVLHSLKENLAECIIKREWIFSLQALDGYLRIYPKLEKGTKTLGKDGIMEAKPSSRARE